MQAEYRLWHVLTLALGHKSIKACQDAIDSAEFASWLAFYTIYPFGPEQDDRRAGIVAATIANIFSGKSSKTIKWEDFFPRPIIETTPTWERLLSKVEAINIALGGKDLRKKKDPTE